MLEVSLVMLALSNLFFKKKVDHVSVREALKKKHTYFGLPSLPSSDLET